MTSVIVNMRLKSKHSSSSNSSSNSNSSYANSDPHHHHHYVHNNNNNNLRRSSTFHPPSSSSSFAQSKMITHPEDHESSTHYYRQQHHHPPSMQKAHLSQQDVISKRLSLPPDLKLPRDLMAKLSSSLSPPIPSPSPAADLQRSPSSPDHHLMMPISRQVRRQSLVRVDEDECFYYFEMLFAAS